MYTKDEAANIRKEFWIGFSKFSKKFYGKRHSWILFDTQIKDIILKFECDKESALVMICFEQRDKNKRLFLFSKFKELKNNNQDFLGYNWIWKDVYSLDSGKEISTLYKQLSAVNIYQREQWTQIYKFFCFEMQKLERNFLLVKDDLKEFSNSYKDDV